MRANALDQKAADKDARVEARTPEGQRYLTEVNRGSINMLMWTQHLNEMWAKGYRLHTAFEQDANTVCVFEKRD